MSLDLGCALTGGNITKSTVSNFICAFILNNVNHIAPTKIASTQALNYKTP